MTTLAEARSTYLDLVARAQTEQPKNAEYIRLLSAAWLEKMAELDADRPCPAQAWLAWMTRCVTSPDVHPTDLTDWVDAFADGVVEMWSRP